MLNSIPCEIESAKTKKNWVGANYHLHHASRTILMKNELIFFWHHICAKYDKS